MPPSADAGLADAAPREVSRRPRRAVGVAPFRRLLLASFVSFVGLWVQNVVAAWVILQQTDSPLMVGIVTASGYLPRLLVGVPAGAWVDVADRRTLLVASNIVMGCLGLSIGVLQFTDRLTPWLLISLSFALGTGNALSMPAYQAVVPDVVPRYLVADAVSTHSASVQLAQALGPGLGSAMVAIDRADLAFCLNGLSYFPLAVAALALPRRAATAARGEGARRAMRAGVRFAALSPVLRSVLLFSFGVATTSACIRALMAPMADREFDVGARGFGALYVSLGLGAVAAAFGQRRLAANRSAQRLASGSAVVLGVAGLVFGVAGSFALGCVALFVAGAAWLVNVSTLVSVVHLTTPGWLRGRALALFYAAFAGSIPLGSILAGVLAEATRPSIAVAVLSSATVVVGIAGWRLPIPPLDERSLDETNEGWDVPTHVDHIAGGPVLVMTTWHVRAENHEAFLDAMVALRAQRYRTGATRWHLLRSDDDDLCLTELFEVADWAEHLRQLGRIDRTTIEALKAVRAFDHMQEPVVRHLIGVDLGSGSRVAPTAVTPG